MKPTLIIFFLIFVFFCVDAQSVDPKYKNVIVVETCYGYSDTAFSNKTEGSRTTEVYNSDGLLQTEIYQSFNKGVWMDATTETYFYYPNGDYDQRIIISNDSTNKYSRLIQKRYFGNNGSFVNTTKNVLNGGFNAIGKIDSNYCCASKKFKGKDSFICEGYIKNGKYRSVYKYSYFYDFLGRLLRNNNYFYDTIRDRYTLKSVAKYNYNDTTQNVGISYYDSNSIFTGYDTIGYDTLAKVVFRESSYIYKRRYTPNFQTYYNYRPNGKLKSKYDYYWKFNKYELSSYKNGDTLGNQDTSISYQSDIYGKTYKSSVSTCSEVVVYTGIGQPSKAEKFNWLIFPNPVQNILNIKREIPFPNSSITITDLSGRIIQNLSLSSELLTHLPVESLSSGIYLIILSVGNKKEVKTFIKQ